MDVDPKTESVPQKMEVDDDKKEGMLECEKAMNREVL
jgi:hypothetical protein